MFALNKIILFYTDPGSGALLLQLITATILGGLFYLRRIKVWIFKDKSADKKVEQVESETNNS